MAWASVTFVPRWCQDEEHWTARFTKTLWTSCPCCATFRGIVIGAVLASVPWLILTLLLCLADD